MRLIIHEDDCNGEGRAFEAYVQKHYPEITIVYRERTSGDGAGLFDDEDYEIDSPDLWADYCNSVVGHPE